MEIGIGADEVVVAALQLIVVASV